ncbi:GTP-binding protein 10 homolog [Rhynchophorus ferrugineus]|uniref:GTP-binding protein 10 homolog n=1 Tax=Rhynchophorus ferrugineus TaxID=354439 RepID=UPI003FCD3104
MVYFTRTLLEKIRRPRKYLKDGFRDSLRIFVSGGPGGNGLPKFGGIGGKGGDVIVEAKEGITLEKVYKNNMSKRYMATPGKSASHNFILGPPGEDLKFEVPTGVTIITDLGKKLGELNNDGDTLIVAKGGTGGHQKNGFLGSRGQVYHVRLDLKLIADIGLVGFPNAGKSTLLKAISDAKPRIASYPFTTIRPNLGIVKYNDLRQISIADLPGLIEGAYYNKGMGHKFLKHVERTKLLLMIVDINGFQLSTKYPHRTCLETIMLLNKELELYNEDLLNKPSLLLINKMDTDGAEQKFKEIKTQLKEFNDFISRYSEEIRPSKCLKFSNIIPISAKESEKDIVLVKQKLRTILDIMNDVSNTNKIDKLYEDIKSSISEKGPQLI